ncbi:ATP-binding cassette domain-containing protein [Gordonia sinesedis]
MAAVVVAAVIPLAAAVRVLAPVPLALIAARTRPRAVVAATVTVTVVSFAMAGTGAALSVFGSALIGALIGELKRRGRGAGAMLLSALLAAPVIGGITALILLILKPLRELVLTALGNTLGGLATWLDKVPALTAAGDTLSGFRTNVLDWWWVWIWVSGAVGTFLTIIAAWWILGAIIARLADVPSEDTIGARAGDGGSNPDEGSVDDGDPSPADDGAVPDPLPVTLTGVGFAYHPGDRTVLHDINLTIGPGEFVAVVGQNGSGKSTLAKILAGRAPTMGTVQRPGTAGLGQRGGTALVLQRPETQMLGARVADDVVWGLPPGVEVDVDALLAEVGLAGLGARETADLSGGQQQRLAIAAALARDPALLIADEVTSMVDPVGRDEILRLLAELPRRRGIGVVLVTHRSAEAAMAQRVVHLVDGRIVDFAPEWLPRAHDLGVAAPVPASGPDAHASHVPHRPHAGPAHGGAHAPLLALTGVGHTYLRGSPWEVRALHDVSLTVNRGDGLLIVGGNGSGKTTLAWILAGLIAPTEGSCLLDGEPVTDHVGDVGLAFQHARLQLQKQTVGDEIMAVGGEKVGTAEVARVLEAVGLPRSMAATRVDALSGGQMRRVVLAGLIARHPDVVILDEPLAGLDPLAREEIIALLGRLRRNGTTIVVISHDFDSLDRVCDRRVHLVDGTIATHWGSIVGTYGAALPAGTAPGPVTDGGE